MTKGDFYIDLIQFRFTFKIRFTGSNLAKYKPEPRKLRSQQKAISESK